MRELVCRHFFRAQIGVKSGAAELLFEPPLGRSRNLERHKEKLISLIFGLRVDDAINNLLQGITRNARARLRTTLAQKQFQWADHIITPPYVSKLLIACLGRSSRVTLLSA